MNELEFKPCNCGYGRGWYHNGAKTRHEYNPWVSVNQATAGFWAERRALGSFYENTNGNILAEITAYSAQGEIVNRQSKEFKPYKTQTAARLAAARWIVESLGSARLLRNQNGSYKKGTDKK